MKEFIQIKREQAIELLKANIDNLPKEVLQNMCDCMFKEARIIIDDPIHQQFAPNDYTYETAKDWLLQELAKPEINLITP